VDNEELLSELYYSQSMLKYKNKTDPFSSPFSQIASSGIFYPSLFRLWRFKSSD
jgi:hypothetical protein